MTGTVVLDYVRGKISASDYWSVVSADMSFAEFCQGCSEWEKQLMDSVHSGFWRLHALDRSVSFWTGTNGLATESKLRDFSEYELMENPRSVDAARLAIAMSLLGGSGHLKASPWRVLVEAGAADFRFLVYSAFATAPYWSDENVDRLSDLVRLLGLHAGTEAALQWLAGIGEAQAEWAGRVRASLAG
jgi:hypothetical protein